MIELSIQEMINAGAHFGHQTRRWNPKMRPYIYGTRSGVHIIDLQQTFSLAQKAFSRIIDIVGGGADVLFIGTKNQAQVAIEEEAKKCGMPYVTRRWLGGMLTNFGTIRQSVEKFVDLESKREKKEFSGLTKRELLEVDRDIARFARTLGGIKQMKKLPGALFVVDPHVEKISVHEANLLGIPVIAIIDSNCDPDPINYCIPANDDSVRSIQIFCSRAAQACLLGLEAREQRAREEEAQGREGPAKRRIDRTAQDITEKGRAYVTHVDSFQSKEGVESFSASVTPPDTAPGPEDTLKEEIKED